MKTYFRVLSFAKPFGKFAIPYFFFILFHAIFNTMNFVMIWPIVETLFHPEGVQNVVTELPPFQVSTNYLTDLINYRLYLHYGTDYDVIQIMVVLSVIVVASVFLSNLFRYLAQRTMESLRIYTLKNLRNAVFSNVMKLHAGFFSNERKGDIISKITADVQVVQYCITSTLQVAFREPFLIAGYVTALLLISAKLTLFTLLVLPVMALVIGRIVKTLRRSATQAQEALGDMVSTVDESLGGIKILKGYNASRYITGRFFRLNEKYSRISKAMANRQMMASPASEFLGVSAVSVILIYGGQLVMSGSIEAAGFLAYLAIFSRVTRPARQLADSFSNIHQGLAAGDRVLELIDTEPAITDAPDAVDLASFRESIEFRNVCFSYENRRILNDISFRIEKGETVALVGPSGGGKETISDLIPRFYVFDQGCILIDGVDLRRYRIESVREHMGIVAQDTVLFNDTIENNIRLGSPDASEEEVIRAAKIANAHEFIVQTENGYKTITGDRCMKLSGGQRQRLSIARAVLRNPDILILDEATSALDTESEKLVQEALNHLLEGRTSLVIAHRLSTIQHADKIIVIDQGEIVESGTHQQLMEIEGVYRKLIEMQQIGAEEPQS